MNALGSLFRLCSHTTLKIVNALLSLSLSLASCLKSEQLWQVECISVLGVSEDRLYDQ